MENETDPLVRAIEGMVEKVVERVLRERVASMLNGSPEPEVPADAAKPAKRTMSAESREKIRKAQIARWKKTKR